MDIVNSMNIAAAGMKAQSERLRVVSENIANADSTSDRPGGLPYRRKIVSFKNVLDKSMGAETVRVSKFGLDKTPLPKKFDPGHPAADADGYVTMPNVNTMIEMMDMREANKSYEANIGVIETSKNMIQQTLNVIR